MITIKKPWGKEELIEKNGRYMFKRLTMTSGHKCSLQYHDKKVETIYLLSGSLRIFMGEAADALTAVELAPHDALTITSGMVHRMEALSESVYLEASTPELDDVVRLEDDYQRI